MQKTPWLWLSKTNNLNGLNKHCKGCLQVVVKLQCKLSIGNVATLPSLYYLFCCSLSYNKFVKTLKTAAISGIFMGIS
jgi:hypothetical protein